MNGYLKYYLFKKVINFVDVITLLKLKNFSGQLFNKVWERDHTWGGHHSKVGS